jgi:TPP-dependent indolepyruvate ferredoxin oxidoreductase alpha subunit
MNLLELITTIENIEDIIEEKIKRMDYETNFYVQEKMGKKQDWILGSTVVLPSVKITTKKVVEAILEHLELRLEYTTGRNPDVMLKPLDTESKEVQTKGEKNV